VVYIRVAGILSSVFKLSILGYKMYLQSFYVRNLYSFLKISKMQPGFPCTNIGMNIFCAKNNYRHFLTE
jgi:hypothetical protein